MTEHRLIVNKLTKAQYEQSSKNPNEVWIITDQLDDYAKTDDIPTKTSELTNDSGFITSDEVPTKVSELDNDSGFITEDDIPPIPSKISELTNDLGLIGGLMRIWKPFVPFDKRPFTVVSSTPNDTVSIIKTGSPDPLSLEYSVDDGETWNEIDVTSTTDIALESSGTLQIRTPESFEGGMQSWAKDGNNRWQIIGLGTHRIEGNINSIIRCDYDDESTYDEKLPDYALYRIFANSTMLTDTSNLIFPSRSVGIQSYAQMFDNCSTMASAPQRIDIVDCDSGSMMQMFRGCTALTKPTPEFKFRNARLQCCYGMFENCTTMTKSPVFSEFEYGWNDAFAQTFKGCTSIQHIYFPKYKGFAPKMFTNICQNASSSGTVHTMSNMTNNPFGTNWVYSYENQEDAEPLTFEATGSYNQVRLKSIEGTAPTLNLNYRFKNADDADYGEWQTYSLGTSIEMYEGDKLQFICSLEHGIEFFNNAEHIYKGFELEGSFTLSGELNSLISSKKCTDIPNWAYWRLFRDIGEDVVLNVDDLVIQGWNTYDYGCNQLFSNDLATSRIEGTLHIDTYVPYNYSYYRVAYQQYGLDCVDFGGNEIDTIQANGFQDALRGSGIQSIRGLKLTNGNITNYAMRDCFNECASLSEVEMDVNYTKTTIGQFAFCNLFSNCTSLQTIDGTLDFSKATYVGQQGFNWLFTRSGLTDARNIIFPENANADPYGYYYMFQGCSALVHPPLKMTVKGSGNKNANYACAIAFTDCTSLVETPELVLEQASNTGAM